MTGYRPSYGIVSSKLTTIIRIGDIVLYMVRRMSSGCMMHTTPWEEMTWQQN